MKLCRMISIMCKCYSSYFFFFVRHSLQSVECHAQGHLCLCNGDLITSSDSSCFFQCLLADFEKLKSH